MERMTIDQLNAELDGGMLVYQYYIAENIRLKKKILSPLREEKHPSFNIFPHRRTGLIWFNDFSLGSGNHWKFVQLLFGLNFPDAVSKVKADILNIRPGEGRSTHYKRVKHYVPKMIPEDDPLIIKPTPRPWEKADLDYFMRAQIDRAQLERFFVNAALSFDLIKKEKTSTIYERRDSPIYTIHFPKHDRYKIYRPFEKKKRFKWMGNTKAEEDVFGYHLLPEKMDKCFIKPGNRDTMSFNKLTGLWTFAFASESANVPLWLYHDLKRRCPVDRTFIMYDPDETGIAKAEKIAMETGYSDITYVMKEAGVEDWSWMVEKEPHKLPAIIEFVQNL